MATKPHGKKGTKSRGGPRTAAAASGPVIATAAAELLPPVSHPGNGHAAGANGIAIEIRADARIEDAKRIQQLEMKVLQLQRELAAARKKTAAAEQELQTIKSRGAVGYLVRRARKGARKRLKRLYERLRGAKPQAAGGVDTAQVLAPSPIAQRIEGSKPEAVEAGDPTHGAVMAVIESIGTDQTGVKIERFAGVVADALSPRTRENILRLKQERGIVAALDKAIDTLEASPEFPDRALGYLRRARGVVRHAEADAELPAPRAHDEAVPGNRRILYLLHMRTPIVNNGYVTRTQLILKAMRDSAFDPVAITRLGFPNDLAAYKDLSPEDIEIIDGTPFHLLRDGHGGQLRRPVDNYIDIYARRVAAAAQGLKPALIHAASNFANGLAAVKAGRLAGLPSLYEVRGLWEVTKVSKSGDYADTFRYRMEQRLELQAVREADRVITLSGALKDHFAAQGVPPEKMFVVPNGIDANEAKPQPRDPALLERLGWPRDSVVVGYVGSLVEYEGIDLVLDAVAKLRRNGHDSLRVLIVGGGAEADTLKAYAERLELGPNAVFTGRVERADALRYYSLIDIAPFARRLLPVTKLVPPIKPFEAMASRKCVIVSDVPALAEFIVPDRTGIVFPAGDSDALARAIAAAAEHPARLKTIAQAGHDWCMAERSLGKISQLLAEAYQGLVVR